MSSTTTTRPVTTAMSNPGSVLLAVTALFWVTLAPDYMIFTVTAAIPVAIAALGLLVLQGWARELSLASAGLFATALYYYGWFVRDNAEGLGIPWVIAAVMAIAISTGLMAALAAGSAKLPGVYLVVITLGLQITIEKFVYTNDVLTGGVTGGTREGESILNPRPYFFGLNLRPDTTFYLFLLGWLALVLVLIVRLRHSPAGLAFLLVGADRQAASAVGISPLRFRVQAFATSGLLAGVGGVLAAWLFMNPPIFLNYGAGASMLLLAIPILAGADSIVAVLIVATTFQVVPVALESWHINSYLLAGVGLALGAAAGSRGAGGRARDLYLRFRHGDRRTRTAHITDTAALRASAGLADDRAAGRDRQVDLETVERWLMPHQGDTDAVRVHDVRVWIGAVNAVRGASFSVPAGSMVGLIGPNGAGKTTLFDVVSGLRPPNSGTVEIFGTDATSLPAWKRSRLGMSRTFQTTRVMTDLTVADNLLAGAYQRIAAGTPRFLAGLPSAWAQLRAAEEVAAALARLLDIDRYWDERTGTLEFSARRRVEIGRCLLAGPRLLLLDEPAAGLDPASSAALFALIRRLHRELGLTVLLVEHYVRAVFDSCDHVHVLDQGSILAGGTPAEIAADAAVRDRYLGTRPVYKGKEPVAVARP